MSISIAVLASLGAAVVVLVAAFLALAHLFERTLAADEGLGIVWLSWVIAVIASMSTFAGGILLAVTA